MTRQADCHPDRPHKAKGLCKPCWSRTRSGRPAASIPAKVVAAAAPSAAPARKVRVVSWSGHPCPADPAHGSLLAAKDGGGWYCAHHAHDGRPATHPAGPAPATRRFFTTEEAERAHA